jgi:hypothetical protein
MKVKNYTLHISIPRAHLPRGNSTLPELGEVFTDQEKDFEQISDEGEIRTYKAQRLCRKHWQLHSLPKMSFFIIHVHYQWHSKIVILD